MKTTMAARGQATRDARAAYSGGENLAGVSDLMDEPASAEPSLPGPTTTFPPVPRSSSRWTTTYCCGNDAQCKENDPTKPFCVDGTCQDCDEEGKGEGEDAVIPGPTGST